MNIRSALLVALCLASAAAASAQYSRANGQYSSVLARTSSSRSPSSELGLVGGTNTRYSAIQTNGARAYSDLSAQISSGNFHFGNYSNRGGASFFDLPAAFKPTLSGVNQVSGSGSSSMAASFLVRWAPPSSEQLASVSGFNLATSLETPVGGWMDAPPPRLQLPPYADPGDSAFHRFFSLEPAPPESQDSTTTMTMDDLTNRIVALNNQRIRDVAGRALQMFHTSTKEHDASDTMIVLPKAMDQLGTVRDMDRSSYLPAILIAHGALERGQYLYALNNIATALNRHPEFFIDNPDLAPFFGTAEFFHSQMRTYEQLGQTNSNSLQAKSLEAYSAFMLGDVRRAETALVDAMRLNIDDSPDSNITILLNALAVGVRAKTGHEVQRPVRVLQPESGSQGR